MNTCRDWNDRLLDYALGTLGTFAVKKVEHHLQHCAACAAALPELQVRRKRLDAALNELAQLVGSAEPSPGFRARVLTAVEAPAAATGWQPAWKGVLATGAIVVLAAVFLPTLGSRWAQRAQPTPEALSEWRSPTESLMHPSAVEFLQSGPRLGEFYFPLESVVSGGSEENGGNNES